VVSDRPHGLDAFHDRGETMAMNRTQFQHGMSLPEFLQRFGRAAVRRGRDG